MTFLNRYKFILLLVLLVITMILIRNSGPGNFRYDAKQYAAPSVINSNTVTSITISSLKGEPLMVVLSEDQKPDSQLKGKTISVRADSIFSGNRINEIRKYNGPVILYSPDCSISARVWMTLAQTGVKNLYIYLSDPDNEVLK